MDIILHVGAHRTGTTSFQHYLRHNRDRLLADRTVIWEPSLLRRGMFDGLFPRERVLNGRNLQRRAMGRVRLHAVQALRAGADRLVISEENIIGAPRACLRATTLYPAAGERLARLGMALEGRVRRVVIGVRSQDLWWASVAAYAVGKGHAVPHPARRADIAQNPRSWRDVITDMACALPGAEIVVAPFERMAGRSDRLLEIATGRPAPTEAADVWLNRSPDRRGLADRLEQAAMPGDDLWQGRWQPFDAAQVSALREAYADDMMWLTAGADGLARLTEETPRDRAGRSLPDGTWIKGHHDDRHPQGYMAHTG
ncbi:hypothetical protein ABMC89_00460 [Sulfitobacter sp. HNIBRBA3233]|uniref:hypothetical protein n=1 Tax=Sulfitobacter marinivivus TaxID=3158558 RepID=UPI0032DED080